jgi:CheY-like chemotaxis protein
MLLQGALPDLVLMDVSMPVMDGFTACAELRKLPDGKRVPVVMITGLDDVAVDRARVRGRRHRFITKPINWSILVIASATCCGPAPR